MRGSRQRQSQVRRVVGRSSKGLFGLRVAGRDQGRGEGAWVGCDTEKDGRRRDARGGTRGHTGGRDATGQGDGRRVPPACAATAHARAPPQRSARAHSTKLAGDPHPVRAFTRAQSQLQANGVTRWGGGGA